MRIPATDRLIVALDVPTEREALKWARHLYPAVKNFKVGLELFCASGPGIVKKIRAIGAGVFLDLKFFDIPNTMAGAVKAALQSGPFILNVHALAGPRALSAVSEAVKSCGQKTKLIAVTVLTSYDEEELKRSHIATPLEQTASALCGMTIRSGLDGVVASPLEVKKLRKTYGNDFLIVTPGVRPLWAEKNDQKRIATPYDAIRNGADYLVVGRPILGAKDPQKAARMVVAEIRKALRDVQ